MGIRRSKSKSNENGKCFEAQLKTWGQLSGLQVIQLPKAGGEIVGGSNFSPKVILRKMPFDFIFIEEKYLDAFIDAKSTEADEIYYNPKIFLKHQVDTLFECFLRKKIAGFIVYFSKLDNVVFFSADKIKLELPKRPLKPCDGLDLGSIYDMKIKRIFWGNDGRIN